MASEKTAQVTTRAASLTARLAVTVANQPPRAIVASDAGWRWDGSASSGIDGFTQGLDGNSHHHPTRQPLVDPEGASGLENPARDDRWPSIAQGLFASWWRRATLAFPSGWSPWGTSAGGR